ncbi:MAG TPA: hypothetical protein VLA66_08870, partial [Thermoanaerobaculia bacterium]|nr:hypothetical protein [Thermoanaerobaculia bacterium]
LEKCPDCRAELARGRELAAGLRSEAAPVPSAHPAQLRRLLERIEAGDLDDEAPAHPPRPARGERLRHWFRRTPAPVRWLLLAQTAALLVFALRPLLPGAPSGTFRTLSEEARPLSALRVRVVFAPSAQEDEIRRLLLEVRAEIVGGPSPLGAYELALGPAGAGEPPETVLRLLRSDPRVLLAEPIPGADVRGR